MHVDEARIESPCDEDLDRMPLTPDGLGRRCDRCQKSVHDLSAMGPEHARAFLAANQGSICISYTSDDEGALVFELPRVPERVPERPKANFVPLARLAQAATLAASLAACAPHGHDPAPQIEEAPAPVEKEWDRVLGGVQPGAEREALRREREEQLRRQQKLIQQELEQEPEIEEPCDEPASAPEPKRFPVKGKRTKTAGIRMRTPDPLG